MKKNSTIHTMVLFVMLTMGILALWYARGQNLVQTGIGITMSLAYVAWGLIHHKLKGDLHRNVVVEYVLVGLIAIILLVTLSI